MLKPFSYNLEESGVVCYTTMFFLKLHSSHFNINLCLIKVLWFSLNLYEIRDKEKILFSSENYFWFLEQFENSCISPDLSGGFLKVAEGSFHCLMIGLVRFENWSRKFQHIMNVFFCNESMRSMRSFWFFKEQIFWPQIKWCLLCITGSTKNVIPSPHTFISFHHFVIV